jgi:ubiquinone/menaquinone biosynthesis C-methylase UbiE
MFDHNWEENIYAKGLHLNKYPYGELVSTYFNSLKYLQSDGKNLLELGCGAGNNLWFFAEQGWLVHAIDGSESAVSYAKKSQENRGVSADIQQAFFQSLPYADNSMDIIIDRESLYCGTKKDIALALQEVARVLKKGGIFISFRFSENNPSLALLEQGLLAGTEVEKHTWQDVESGTFSATGIVHFSTFDELEESHRAFLDLKFISEHSSRTLKDYTNENEFFYSEYILVGVGK